MKKVSVVFVCLGNICRSPTAHGIFRQMVIDRGLEREIKIDSAGTAAYHIGKQADARSREVALQRGIDMEDLRARQVNLGDIIEFDYILAMDEANYSDLLDLALPEYRHKIRLFLEFAPQFEEKEVPDPYYGGDEGFQFVFELVTAASEGLLSEIEQKYGLHK